MLRIALLLVVVLAVLWWLGVVTLRLRAFVTALRDAGRAMEEAGRGAGRVRAGAGPAAPERLVACAVCGVFVAEGRALAGSGAAGSPASPRYCSETCRRRAAVAS